MAPSLRSEVSRAGARAIIRFFGEFDPHTWPELHKVTMQVLLEDKPLALLTIDLSEVTFASPSGIEALLDATEECRKAGIEFDLVSNRRINRTLELLGYDWLVDVPDIIGVENSMMRAVEADEQAREPD